MEWIIGEESDQVRLDRYLRKKYKEIPLSGIFKGIRSGAVRVNGKKREESYRLQKGDRINVPWETAPQEKNEAGPRLSREERKKIREGIFYEDEEILVFYKDAGMVMHKGSGHAYGLSEMLKVYCGNPDFNFVNRIDKNTAGLVLGAKKLPAARLLARDIRNREIVKRYYILVEGAMRETKFSLHGFLKKMPDRVSAVSEAEEGAKESQSDFTVLRKTKNHTLLSGELKSGRTHQLRVQLANYGFPIVGDEKYGRKEKEGKKEEAREMFLFSYYLRIPRLGLELEAPLPEGFLRKLSR